MQKVNNQHEAHKLAVEIAARSTAVKRKVGAIIVDHVGMVLSVGWNHNMADPNGPCEDSKGQTLDTVIHAEAAAIKAWPEFTEYEPVLPLMMLVTHEPCTGCQAAIKAAGIERIEVVGEFLKFDTDKLRYDLVPVSAMKGLAKVLTYGAKKYKPNNWRTVVDTERYVAAAYRHLEAWRAGELHDAESGCYHLEHALTNIAFLLELDAKPSPFNKDKRIRK